MLILLHKIIWKKLEMSFLDNQQNEFEIKKGSCLYLDYKGQQFSSVLYNYYYNQSYARSLEEDFETFPLKKEDIVSSGFLDYFFQSIAEHKFEPLELYIPFQSNLCQEIVFYTQGMKEINFKNASFLLNSINKEEKHHYFLKHANILKHFIHQAHYEFIDLLIEHGASTYINNRHILDWSIDSKDFYLVKHIAKYVSFNEAIQSKEKFNHYVTKHPLAFAPRYIELCHHFLNSLVLNEKLHVVLDTKKNLQGDVFKKPQLKI